MMANDKKQVETWNKAEDIGARLRQEKEEARKEEVKAESKRIAKTNAAWDQYMKEARERKAREMEAALKKAAEDALPKKVSEAAHDGAEKE